MSVPTASLTCHAWIPSARVIVRSALRQPACAPDFGLPRSPIGAAEINALVALGWRSAPGTSVQTVLLQDPSTLPLQKFSNLQTRPVICGLSRQARLRTGP